MPNLNKFLFMGNLCANPELRYTKSNKSVCNFRAVTNEKQGEQDVPTFLDFVAWNATAENIGKFLQKGSPIYVEGKICVEQYQDKTGNKRTKQYILCERVQFLGGGNRNSNPNGHQVPRSDIPQRKAPQPPPPPSPPEYQQETTNGIQDDMPF